MGTLGQIKQKSLELLKKERLCVHCNKPVHPSRYFCDMECELAYCDAENEKTLNRRQRSYSN